MSGGIGHSTHLGARRFVYAVVSRRAGGLSVGVNLNVDKICNFACPYCQVDRRAPAHPDPVDVVALTTELGTLLRDARGPLWATSPFDRLAPDARRIVDVAFAGDGEPTSSPSFAEAASAARRCVDETAAGVPLRLLTNATLLHRPVVQDALDAFDEVWCKLDAGTPEWFAWVNGTTLPLQRVLSNLARTAARRSIVVQSMLVARDGHPPAASELDAYVERVRELREGGARIARVQLYSVARPPAESSVGAVPNALLHDVSERLRALGLTTQVIEA